MSFVGPRPLLPIDQPAAPMIRLSMFPGVTGWAQSMVVDVLVRKKKERWKGSDSKHADKTLRSSQAWGGLATRRVSSTCPVSFDA
jgi:lipopolysaccharide/colanic/teichoic acid biosynthesis glycosyltransferase